MLMLRKVHNRILALWKLCLSFRKDDWELGDYPVAVKEQQNDPAFQNKRGKPRKFMAFIVNWGLAGFGDTENEAIRDLAKNFASAKVAKERTHTATPRPGTDVDIPVEFSSSERVNAHPELAGDFIDRVLGLGWAWISDESTLWDFPPENRRRV